MKVFAQSCRRWRQRPQALEQRVAAVPVRARHFRAAIAGLFALLPVHGAARLARGPAAASSSGAARATRRLAGATGAARAARATRCRWLDRAARAAGGGDLGHAQRATAAVAGDRAGAARGHAAVGAAAQHALGVGCTRSVVAAVSARRASFTAASAAVPQTVAARHTEPIEQTHPRVAGRGAARVTRRGDAASVVFEVTDVALRIAAGRIATQAHARTRLDLAAHVAFARQARICCAAAVSVPSAQTTVRMAAARRLTYGDPRIAVRRTQSAAAATAAVADGAVDLSGTVRRARHRQAADSELAVCCAAAARAAIARATAHITSLRAERALDLTCSLAAELRAALVIAVTCVAAGATGRVQRDALTVVARAAAAFAVARTAAFVRDAGGGRALTA